MSEEVEALKQNAEWLASYARYLLSAKGELEAAWGKVGDADDRSRQLRDAYKLVHSLKFYSLAGMVGLCHCRLCSLTGDSERLGQAELVRDQNLPDMKRQALDELQAAARLLDNPDEPEASRASVELINLLLYVDVSLNSVIEHARQGVAHLEAWDNRLEHHAKRIDALLETRKPEFPQAVQDIMGGSKRLDRTHRQGMERAIKLVEAEEAANQPSPRPQAEPSTDAPAEHYMSTEASTLSAEDRAMGVLSNNPGLNMTELAQAAGVSRQHLYNMPNLANARRAIQSGRGDIPRGRKTLDGDVEAY